MLLFPFLLMAVAGLFLSIVAHAAALLGQPQPLGQATWALHVGIFVVWAPALFRANRVTVGVERRDRWRAVTGGCPAWVGGVVAGFFLYAFVNLLLCVAVVLGGGGADAPGEFRAFSGHWMAFYGAAAAVLYSAIVVGWDPRGGAR
jgi:hypothetical protein